MILKICGLTTPDAVSAAVGSGADALGFVFAPGSPRDLSPARAERLLAGVPAGVIRVAVFRRPDPEVLRAVLSLPFDLVQADADWRGELGEVGFLPAFNDGPDLLERLGPLLGRPDVRLGEGGPTLRRLRGAFLVDGPAGGGRGVRGDPERAAEAARRGPLVLAGGLDPDNVGQAVIAIRPLGVDVSSGVESAPGVKDPWKIERFAMAARAAEVS